MPRAYWTTSDEENLLDFLIEMKSQGCDGGFKTVTWVGAAAKVNETKTRGLLQIQLKAIYEIVRAIRSNSGWSWDDELGADIDSDRDAKEGKWNDYIEKHPDAAPFRNKGWPHLSRYDELCGHSAPKGLHVFHASQTHSVAVDDATSTGTADSDEGEKEEKGADEDQASKADSTSEENQPAKTPARSNHKHAASSAPPSNNVKRARETPGTKLMGSISTLLIATSYDRVTNLLEKVLQPDGPSTPARKQKVIAFAMDLEEDWLRGRDLARLINVLEKEPYAAEGYVQVMKNTKLHKNWV
ncbi:hypothetical protein BDZ97DRAFT_1668203 [Flammula alnicola]|nr:hypothetical protein BDZ97DRAFT_1668203 [Flammula alnicola]